MLEYLPGSSPILLVEPKSCEPSAQLHQWSLRANYTSVSVNSIQLFPKWEVNNIQLSFEGEMNSIQLSPEGEVNTIQLFPEGEVKSIQLSPGREGEEYTTIP